jgi:putative toxin-antitoxin system antitoxin component (TIGR02293 family)
MTAEFLGGESVLRQRVETAAALRRAVTDGLPKDTIRHIARTISTDRKAQRKVMHRIVPEPTFKRRKDRLSPAESEKAERLARTVALAFHIWGEEDGREFLTTPHPMLGGETPVEAAVTDLGAREVEAILRAIEFGLPV